MPRRIEPVFRRRTPLLFAHRGGAKEVPESTLLTFRHAIGEARSDVLEIDLQLTGDRRAVVWHGPELDNVRLACAPHDLGQRRAAGPFEIGYFSWAELERGS